MKLQKGDVKKDIPDNLVSHYLNMGWKEVKETKPILPEKPQESQNKPN